MEIVGIFLKKATSIMLLLVTAITLVLHHFLNMCQNSNQKFILIRILDDILPADLRGVFFS